ncbi:MAG: beta-lactamase family protein [Sphingomonas sp.]|nr:beta-lactamase family protein [Sphingomonas sp.]
MMTLNRIVCASGAALVLGACQSMPSPAPAPALRTAVVPQQKSYFPSDAELRELLQVLVEQGQSEGFVLGLLEPDGRRRVIAYGDAGAGAPPLSSRSVFETGSIVKTFTGAILADMVRRGAVSLNDPVAKFLPAGVKVPSRNGRQITLLDLATHTSGLPRNLDQDKVRDPSNPYADIPIEDVYEFLSSHELRRDIGAKWEYSNLGFGLLGHALTRVAGVETVDELVRERITGPLKMGTTQFGRGNGLEARMAKGHDQYGDVVPYWNFGAFKGAGGLNSTVEDMLTYLNANVGEPGSPIEAAMRDAHQPRHDLDIKGNAAALGWDYRARPGRTIVYKSGSTAGFAGALGFDPDTGAGVVILGNGKGFESRVNVVIQLLKGGRPEFRKTSVPLSEIEPLLGLYEYEGGNRRFFTKDGKLFTRLSGGQDMEVFPAADDRFFYGPGTLSWFEVKRDAGGKHVMSMYPGGSGEADTSVRTGPVPAG